MGNHCKVYSYRVQLHEEQMLDQIYVHTHNTQTCMCSYMTRYHISTSYMMVSAVKIKYVIK